MISKENVSTSATRNAPRPVISTPGLNDFDHQREASMADEGGTSGAYMETQDRAFQKSLHQRFAHYQKTNGSFRTAAVIATGALAAAVGLGLLARTISRARA